MQYFVLTHRFFRAAESDIFLMKKIKKDESLQNMALGKSKISYVINYGLGPYFDAELRKNVKITSSGLMKV